MKIKIQPILAYMNSSNRVPKRVSSENIDELFALWTIYFVSNYFVMEIFID